MHTLLRSLLGISFFGLVLSANSQASQALVDPKQELTTWLSNRANNASVLSACTNSAQSQYQAFLILNPSITDPNALQEAQTIPLLQCLYGIYLVNLSLCIGQPAGCTSTSLLIPTSTDLQNTTSTSASSPTLNSIVY